MSGEPKINPVKKFLRKKSFSESSDDTESTDPMRQRSGSVNSREAGMASADNKLENFLYDKYLANFFNPLHAKPTGEGLAPETIKSKGILYDVDGKFAYSTYSEEMRSYHPMLDIKALTKDLK